MCCIRLLYCFIVVFWLYHLLSVRVKLILVVFNGVHMRFLSFDDVFGVFFRLGWTGSFYAENKQVLVPSRFFTFFCKCCYKLFRLFKLFQLFLLCFMCFVGCLSCYRIGLFCSRLPEVNFKC